MKETFNIQHSTSKSERGIALVITLIMLAITLVMAVAFMALARRERGSVNTTTDTTTARLAADTAAANAEAQIVANILGGFTNGGSGNAYNLGLLVSTNYINPLGFTTANGSSPTNVNYPNANASGNVADWEQNIANLWFLPRAPVFVPTNGPTPGYDFRYYLDLNENGQFDPNGWQAASGYNPANGLYYYDTNGNEVLAANVSPPNVLSNYFVGDPEWVGVLDHPDAPHSANNHFVSRYVFMAVPVGNGLDVNYIHNEVQNTKLTSNDGYMRNQGVGAWEINLAAFLADLNTNVWGRAVGSWLGAQPNAATYYEYNEPGGSANSGYAFQDALSLLDYRYNNFSLPGANSYFFNAVNIFPNDGLDDYGQGPLQTTLDTNEDFLAPAVNTATPWSGADNPNHYFALSDFLDPSKTAMNLSPATVAAGNDFSARLKAAGSGVDTYDRYTYYRMLSELGTDSSADDGKLNLNYANAVVNYTAVGGVNLPTGIGVVTGMETNLTPWVPINFFHAAADQMLRLYTANWYNANPLAFINTFNVTAPFSITNIPVLVSNQFVYTPSVNRLLQLAANLYDATMNGNDNLPHVFRPVFERVNSYNNDIYIVGYVPVTSVNGANPQLDPQLQSPTNITQLAGVPLNTPILNQGVPINVYGVPWIIGAKKGLPSFNQLYMTNTVQVTRDLQINRNQVGDPPSKFWTNELFVMSFNTGLGASFWNSYQTTYPRPLTVYAADALSTTLVASNSVNNQTYTWPTNTVFYLSYNVNNTVGVNSWPGTQWYGTPPNAVINNPANANCFLTAYWPLNFLNSPVAYQFSPPGFVPIGTPNNLPWQNASPTLTPLPQFYLAITNYLQAYILDGNNVIDYVQFRDPSTTTNITAAMADPPYQGNAAHYQWSTNLTSFGLPYGIYNQYYVSSQPSAAPAFGGQWTSPSGFLPAQMLNGLNANQVPAAESAFFNSFFTGVGFYFNGQAYNNTQLSIQAPYTPTRTVFSPFLLQANDPMVHYLNSDLNGQSGASAVWGGSHPIWPNGFWKNVDDTKNSPLPTAPSTPVGGRFQPWGVPPPNPVQGGDQTGYLTTYKDSLAWGPDTWDFPTNQYPSVGRIGRVHRGTPWQTVYLKASDVLTTPFNNGTFGVQNVGSNMWAQWTGDIAQDYYTGQYVDGARSAPAEDSLLFDLFTTRFNDNSARGRLPVNAGAGLPDGGLAAWSALFSGMVALSNSAVNLFGPTGLTYTNLIINPAGIDLADSPLAQIVNNTSNGISAIRANKNVFPFQTFGHVGDILRVPLLSEQSPFLNWSDPFQQKYGISDELYEWLPQQMMGLVRGSEPRYVVDCIGQTLKPAPGGEVVGGSFSQLITNYQVVAESDVRVVLRVENANTAHPHVVVESYNVLPPN